MKNLLYKELRLCMPVQAWIYFFMIITVIVPTWPPIIGFYMPLVACNIIFPLALANRDFLYSKLLPIPKSDIVRGKFLLILFIELISLVVGGLLLILRFFFIQPYFEFLMGADFGTLGVALLMYGVFNLIFLPWLFAKPEKPVWSILVSCLAAAIIFGIYIGICGTIPELALLINSFAPEYIGIQLSMLGGGLILFALLTVLAYTLAKRNFLRSE
ncbi:MAG: ABC-2 transporter permease [Candidatus Enteromonas sp.]|nr:ABC-2 transporter permease [Candidatus Enteromonas sp.]